MKTIIVSCGLILAACAGGVALACDADIMCPDNWIWSDREGTCIHISERTT